MLFTQTYAKPSGISHAGGQSLIDFAPDLGREPTFFWGKIADPIRYLGCDGGPSRCGRL